MSDMNAELISKHPCIGDARNIGLFGILELVKDRNTREPITPFNQSNDIMKRLKSELLREGLFLYTHWHTILIIPPLIINQEQLLEGYQIIDRALTAVDRTLIK
jgi:taurine--2-oxoglutarate transaminase